MANTNEGNLSPVHANKPINGDPRVVLFHAIWFQAGVAFSGPSDSLRVIMSKQTFRFWHFKTFPLALRIGWTFCQGVNSRIDGRARSKIDQLKPNSLKTVSFWRHFSFTLTNSSRKTGRPKKSSISCRAICPTCLSAMPCLPMTMAF